jgi:hypothetical protein
MTPAPLYINEADAARMLGKPTSWLRSNVTTLERQYGFPKVDPAVGMRHKEAIEAWARDRNVRKQSSALSEISKENKDAL